MKGKEFRIFRIKKQNLKNLRIFQIFFFRIERISNWNLSNFSNFFAFSNQSNSKFSYRIERISNESQFDSTPNQNHIYNNIGKSFMKLNSNINVIFVINPWRVQEIYVNISKYHMKRLEFLVIFAIMIFLWVILMHIEKVTVKLNTNVTYVALTLKEKRHGISHCKVSQRKYPSKIWLWPMQCEI